MPKTRTATRYFHVTGCLIAPHAQLRRTGQYKHMLRQLSAQLRTHDVQLLSFCLLPNAWDLVVAAEGTERLNALIKGVRTTPCLSTPEATRHRMPILVTPLVTGGALVGRCVLVERRPVSRGLVRQAQDWPWCSAAERFRLQTRVPLVSPRMLLSQAWFDHLNVPRPGDASHPVDRHNLAQPPRLLASRPQLGDDTVGIRGTAHQNHPDAHVEGPEHLGVGNRAAALQPGEQRRHGPASPIE
jgi:hypothetical protein